MNRTATIGLVAASLLVLGGSWLLSRSLTSDVATPPAASRTTPPADPGPPPVPVHAPPLREPPAPAPAPVAPEVAGNPAQPAPQPAPEPEVDPESIYADEKAPEIEHAWKEVNNPASTPIELSHAAKIFRRCLVQVPSNQRCQQGLAAVLPKLPAELPRDTNVPTPLNTRHARSSDDE